ncbi:MAG TPA: nitroreductase family protein [Thermoplasmatales archaeon]|nr:nitroreductase family protein [Thermoplasmatales archaeon]
MENEVILCIKGRRSIRNYSEKSLSKEIIEAIINAGRYAPSAEDRQPWRFIVITDRDFIKKLSEEVKKQIANILKNKRKWRKKFKELNDNRAILFLSAVAKSKRDSIFFDAPVVIFIVTDKVMFNDESCACCAQNMMLSAWSMGVGSCWIGFAKFLEMSKEIIEEIGIPDGYHISACLTFGYPEKIPKPSLRKPTADVIKWIE